MAFHRMPQRATWLASPTSGAGVALRRSELVGNGRADDAEVRLHVIRRARREPKILLSKVNVEIFSARGPIAIEGIFNAAAERISCLELALGSAEDMLINLYVAHCDAGCDIWKPTIKSVAHTATDGSESIQPRFGTEAAAADTRREFFLEAQIIDIAFNTKEPTDRIDSWPRPKRRR